MQGKSVRFPWRQKKKKKKLTRVKSERERNEWRKRRSTECHGRTKTSATLEKKLM